MITLFGHAVPQGGQNRRVTADFNHIIFDREVVCIECEAVFHHGIFVQTGVFENDHALFGEHKRNAAARAEVAAEFVEVVANIASRPVFVVGQAFYDDSNAIRAIAFIDDGFIVVLIAAAGSLLNDPFDVVVWHIVGLCFCNQIPQLCIAARVSTALFDADGDFSSDFCENFCFCGISRFFFPFDIIPFRMSGHGCSSFRLIFCCICRQNGLECGSLPNLLHQFLHAVGCTGQIEIAKQRFQPGRIAIFCLMGMLGSGISAP